MTTDIWFILTVVFLGVALIFSLSLIIIYFVFRFKKMKERSLKIKHNEMMLVNFEIKQKIITSLSEFNSQIDPICGYSLTFQEDYFWALKEVEKELKKLSKFNSNFMWVKAKSLETDVINNILLIDESIKKHDQIINDASASFEIISNIALFYQKIVKDVIKLFEENLSIIHHGPAINKYIYEVSSLLILIEENKLRNDINEVSVVSAKILMTIKKLIDYLKDVHIILTASSYIKNSIEEIENVLFSKIDLFKTRRDIHITEKSVLKLKKIYSKIIEQEFGFNVHDKKKYIDHSFEILKEISDDINDNISTKNIQDDYIDKIFKWILFLENNKSKVNEFFNLVSKSTFGNNEETNIEFRKKIDKITVLYDRIIANKKIIYDKSIIERYGANIYIEQIKKIVNWIYDLKFLINDLNKDVNHIFKNMMARIEKINSYKLTLITINGKINDLNSNIKAPYRPTVLISLLNQIEQRVMSSVSNEKKMEKIDTQILNIGYKIFEINNVIVNDQKLNYYFSQIIIKFNRFYNEPDFDDALKIFVGHYHKGDYLKALHQIIKKYNKYVRKYKNAKKTFNSIWNR